MDYETTSPQKLLLRSLYATNLPLCGLISNNCDFLTVTELSSVALGFMPSIVYRSVFELIGSQNHSAQVIAFPNLLRRCSIFGIVIGEGRPLEAMLQVASTEATNLLIFPLLS
jgi:hypothetical protein